MTLWRFHTSIQCADLLQLDGIHFEIPVCRISDRNPTQINLSQFSQTSFQISPNLLLRNFNYPGRYYGLRFFNLETVLVRACLPVTSENHHFNDSPDLLLTGLRHTKVHYRDSVAFRYRISKITKENRIIVCTFNMNKIAKMQHNMTTAKKVIECYN